MKHRKLWALLTAAAALLVLAVFVSADTADVIELTHTIGLDADGTISQFDKADADTPPELNKFGYTWKADGAETKKLTESGKITYDAKAKEWIISNLNLVVKDGEDSLTCGVAIKVTGDCKVVFKGENSITFDGTAMTHYDGYDSAIWTEGKTVILGREENGKTPTLTLSAKVSEASSARPCAVYAGNNDYTGANIRIEGLKLTANNDIYCDYDSIEIKDCPGFVIDGDEEGIYAYDGVTIKNCENFRITALGDNGAGINGGQGNVVINNCGGFSVSVNPDKTMIGIKCFGDITIDGCEGFSVVAGQEAILLSNDGYRPQLLLTSEEESGDEDDKAIGITLKNSPNFRLYSALSHAVLVKFVQDYDTDIKVAIDNCPGFETKSFWNGIAVFGTEVGNISVDINKCPGFKINTFAKWDEYGIRVSSSFYADMISKMPETSVVISNSDNFEINGQGGINNVCFEFGENGIDSITGSVKIDSCKNFKINAENQYAVRAVEYNVNASTGYILADGDDTMFYRTADIYSRETDNALITHTGGTVADKEVCVTYEKVMDDENEGYLIRHEHYMENAEEFEKTKEYAKKVVYTIPEPEPEPETKKSFRLPNLIEIRFETNGGEKLRSALSTPGYSLRLAKYVPEREGYTFTGWYSDKALTKKLERIVAFDDTTIYAGWTKNEG